MTRSLNELEIGNASAFQSFVRVRFSDVDMLGHVNNAAYLNYLEQAAIDHAEYLGLNIELLRNMGGIFVARRHTIVFHRPAKAGELLRVITWLGEPSGATVERQYRVSREEFARATIPTRGTAVTQEEIGSGDSLIVSAVTEWVFTSESGRPRRIPPEMKSILGNGPKA